MPESCATIFGACKTVATPKDLLACLSGAARSAQPDVLVSSCAALPGLSKPEVVSCMVHAARSPTPDLVIDACTSAAVFGPEDRIACIAAAVGVDLVNTASGAGLP